MADVSLRLEPGTRTALVGASGSGKSTIVNLLLRFLDPSRGPYCGQRLPLSELSLDAWREQVALVPQRPYLFYGSVLDNIRLARPEATDDEVHAAAELAGAADSSRSSVMATRRSLASRVPSQPGTGATSGAGASLSENASFVVLDEPTSSLDPESEEQHPTGA